MSDARRYRDEEIRRIFTLATKGDDGGTSLVPTPDGLTLSELQDVGREVGLEPGRVARAALALDSHQESLPRGKTLGMPTSVSRIVELPRDATDHEWELLVTELRTTFGAKGDATSHGGLREWSNGNLHAFLEPTESGHRLRLTTVKSGVMERNLAGGFLLSLALMLLVLLVGKGKPEALALPGFIGFMGVGILALNNLGLPRWANERERQMERIASRAKALLSAPAHDEDARD